MFFTVERNTLLRALGHVTGLVERRNTIPILGNVLIGTDGEASIAVKATDLDMEAVETLPAKIEQPGAVTISAHTLHDIVRKLPDGAEIKIDRGSTDGRLKVQAGRSTFELAILPAEEFPNMGQVELPHRFSLPKAELKRLFDKARFAVSTEETRYYLNGIYLHAIDPGGGFRLRAVATDGHRLAQVETDCPDGAQQMPGVIVPRKAVAEVIKLLDGGDKPVTVSLSDAKIQFEADEVVLTSKLIDGTFPDYARVIPSNNKKIMTLENADLVTAVDRVSTLSSEKGRAVKLNISQGRLLVSANSPESGSANEEINAEYEGEPMEIGFNARYLLDIAAQIGGARTQFKLADGSSPTLVLEEGESTALYVLMPMRV